MRKFCVSLSVFLCGFVFAVGNLSAGTGVSPVVLKNLHSFKIYYGSTEISSTHSLINYIDAEVSVPGLRGSDDVWASPTILPDSLQPSIYSGVGTTFKAFGPGYSSKILRFRVYTPSSPSARIRVRRGWNQIRVKFTYQYLGALDPSYCATLCGNATAVVTVR